MLRYLALNFFDFFIAVWDAITKTNLGIVRRVGKSRAIAAIAKILPVTIHTLLSRRVRFVGQANSFPKNKIGAMEEMAKSPRKSKDIECRAEILREAGTRKVSDQP